MLVLITYDVSTQDAAGSRRLRNVAKACEAHGQRVQNSVFECTVDWSQWISLKTQLEEICEPTVDSLRYYNLGNNYTEKVVHYGAKQTVDPAADTLIV